jgi:SAM-dependent methyltransferase
VAGRRCFVAKILEWGAGFVLHLRRAKILSQLYFGRSKGRTANALESTVRLTEGEVGDPSGNRTYTGHRILEAMRSAPRYASAIYARAKFACAKSESPILEFGAGDGVFVERFLTDGMIVDCVEPDPFNQASLRALGAHVVANINQVGDDQYEFAYTINVLEHLSEVDRYLIELRRVLRPGGRLFVFVPAFAILWTSLDDEVGHVQRFTIRTLTEHTERTGFQLDACSYFDSIGFFAALSVRVMEKLGLCEYSPRTIGFYDKAAVRMSIFCDKFLSRFLGKNVIAVVRKST